MAAQPRPGIKGHEAERLRSRRVDHFPDIDAHAHGQHLQLVDQRDVHAAKNIFQQLGHFRGARRTDRHHPRPPSGRTAPPPRARWGGFTPPTTLGICARPYCLFPGSSRSGENARKKSVAICSLSGPCAIGHCKPLASRIGNTSSSVVPGYVVDSSTTSCPRCKCG